MNIPIKLKKVSGYPTTATMPEIRDLPENTLLREGLVQQLESTVLLI